MTVESASYISQLNTSLPASTDPKSEGPAHFQLIKSVLKTQFPNFGTAAMNASHTELNYMVGVTSAVQTQLNARAQKAGDTYTGAHNFTGASSVTAPTPTTGDSSNNVATTAFVAATAFAAALPGQTGNNGKLLTTNGSAASWTDTITTSKTITGDFTLSGTARRIYGDVEGGTAPANRLLFTAENSSATSAIVGVCPRSSPGTGGAWVAYANPDPSLSANMSLFCNAFAGKAGLNSGGSGGLLGQPLVLQMDGADALQIDTSRNIRSVGGGAIGYGAGSGGTVTQLTSKSTNVTLNKPCGQITMNNAALAAGASVSFTLINSFITPSDGVLVNVAGAMANAGSYRLAWYTGNTGSVLITVTNQHSVSLSEAFVLTFQVIKGATS